jgi:hypothetical protein
MRKYDDHEVRQILDLAMSEAGHDDAPARSLPSSDGLTLAQLQEVAAEVGVPAERVAQAAAQLESRGVVVPRRTTLGLPTGVGRVVPLPRAPTDHEWEMLIGEFRSTFGVNGVATSQGGLREWTHGTLHVFVEPTDTGHRLRLTDSSLAMGGIALGGFLLALALMIFVVLLGKENPGNRAIVPAMFSLFGGGLIAFSAMSMPRWARVAEQRMEQVGNRALTILSRPAAKGD